MRLYVYVQTCKYRLEEGFFGYYR